MLVKLMGSIIGSVSTLRTQLMIFGVVLAVASYKSYTTGYSVGRESGLTEQVAAMEQQMAELESHYIKKLDEYESSVSIADSATETTQVFIDRIVEVEVPKYVTQTEIIEVCTSNSTDTIATYDGLLPQYNAAIRASREASPD